MECTHAYLRKDIEYLLCDFEPQPSRANRPSLFHAVCAHQAHCPKQNCHKNTPSWVNCAKLAEKPQDDAGERFDEAVSTQEEATEKRTRRATKPESEE